MPPVLRIEQLSKNYGSLRVLDSLALELQPGEALGIIGPNGAGKSTLVDVIAGDLAPDRGRIHFRGQDITALPAFTRCRLGIGRTYQIPHPFAKMTVFENVLAGSAFGRGRPERQCYDDSAAILVETGLSAKANTLAGSLTLLERKRLELARALATGPQLLLLDEIAGGLTEGEVGSLIDTIRSLRAGGVTIVWIEHIVHALLSVVDRLMVINFGSKLADGPPREVLNSPAVQEVYLGLDAA
jgi:branched-chain amino acid transport system ATP-binding protein